MEESSDKRPDAGSSSDEDEAGGDTPEKRSELIGRLKDYHNNRSCKRFPYEKGEYHQCIVNPLGGYITVQLLDLSQKMCRHTERPGAADGTLPPRGRDSTDHALPPGPSPA